MLDQVTDRDHRLPVDYRHGADAHGTGHLRHPSLASPSLRRRWCSLLPNPMVAVNHQLRYDEGMAAARDMVREGWIGEPTAMSFDVNIQTDRSAWTWLVGSPRLDLFFHSIHYLDAVRGILGDPKACVRRRLPQARPSCGRRNSNDHNFAVRRGGPAIPARQS
jgi:hypothetical protein